MTEVSRGKCFKIKWVILKYNKMGDHYTERSISEYYSDLFTLFTDMYGK